MHATQAMSRGIVTPSVDSCEVVIVATQSSEVQYRFRGEVRSLRLLPPFSAFEFTGLDQLFDRARDEAFGRFGLAVAEGAGIDKILKVRLNLRVGADRQLLRRDAILGSRHAGIIAMFLRKVSGFFPGKFPEVTESPAARLALRRL